MDACRLTLAGIELVAYPSGALFWPDEGLLCVADLHLGRSERLARRAGSLLPPYETRDTLGRLEIEMCRLRPRHVLCLGDSFDDDTAAAALLPEDAALLARLAAGVAWTWIAGNHDPAPPAAHGRHAGELRLGPLLFRHIADPAAPPGEVSGHFHPKLRRLVGGVAVARPCFVTDGRRLILPAFGAYTGGLDASAPPVASLMADGARAILTGTPCLALPLRPGRRALPRSRAQFA